MHRLDLVTLSDFKCSRFTMSTKVCSEMDKTDDFDNGPQIAVS